MKISGILEQNSTVTLPRLLERIFDTDRPGELLLKHKTTGLEAVLTIKHGEVAGSTYGELTNEAALQAIGQTFPWIYEFKASGAAQGDGSLGGPTLLPNAPVRAVGSRLARPALKAPGSGPRPVVTAAQPAQTLAAAASIKPVPLQGDPADGSNEKRTRRNRPYLRFLGVKYAIGKTEEAEAPPLPILDLRSLHTPETLRAWVADAGTGSLRFFDFDGVRHGDVSVEEWNYFRADQSFISRMAANIGAALGFSTATMVSVVEPQRAACYWKINDGFAGAYKGSEASVADFIAKF